MPDEFEASGLVLSNAQVVYTDPENPDCDDDDLLDGQEISIDGAKSKTVKVGSADGGYITYSTVVFKYNSNPNNEDTDGDGLYDDIDFDPIHSATEEQLKILEFFESAELFEIRYLTDFCERFECSPIIAIDYINVYRRYADYAIDEVIEDLASVGYKCDKAAFRIYYTEYFNYRNNTSFAQIMSENSSEWSYFFKIFMAEWVGGVTKQFLENCKEWDYSKEYKLSLEQEKSLKNVVDAKRTGLLRGDIKRLNANERKVVSELLDEGRSIEVLPEGTQSSPDFVVDGLKTELKTLENHNLNTPLKKIRKAFNQQGADAIIYDVRPAQLTEADVNIVYQRITGIYDGKIPGIIEFWTTDGKVIFNP